LQLRKRQVLVEGSSVRKATEAEAQMAQRRAKATESHIEDKDKTRGVLEEEEVCSDMLESADLGLVEYERIEQSGWSDMSDWEVQQRNLDYQPLYPELWELFDDPDRWIRNFVHPEFLEMLLEGDYERYVDKVCPHVFALPVFTEEFCRKLVLEANLFDEWQENTGGDKEYPVIDLSLRAFFNLEQVIHSFYDAHLTAFIEKLYLGWRPKQYCWSFVTKYEKENNFLDFHYDIGTNLGAIVCLNNDFEGGGTHFLQQDYHHENKKIGWITLHPGQLTHKHSGCRVSRGTRYIVTTFIR